MLSDVIVLQRFSDVIVLSGVIVLQRSVMSLCCRQRFSDVIVLSDVIALQTEVQ